MTSYEPSGNKKFQRNRSSFMIELVDPSEDAQEGMFRRGVNLFKRKVRDLRGGETLRVFPATANETTSVHIRPPTSVRQTHVAPNGWIRIGRNTILYVRKFMILPDSMFRTRWDMLLLVLVLYYGVLIPIRVAFGGEEEDPETAQEFLMLYIDMFANVVFSVDMVINFRTAYRMNGVLVTDEYKVAWNYFKFWFFVDLVSVLPFDLFFGSDASGAFNYNVLLRMLRIFKLFRVFRVMRILKRLEEVTKMNPAVLKLGKMFVLLLFIWHIIACTYWLVAAIENFGFTMVDSVNGSLPVIVQTFNRDGGNLWVPPPELWCEGIETTMCNETAFLNFEEVNGYNPFKGVDYCFAIGFCPVGGGIQYVNAFFWAVMVTTGIGRDIMPVTVLEHIFSFTMILMGICMYAVIISSLSSLLSNLDVEKAERKKKQDSIRQFLRQKKVPLSLQRRIQAYYEYLWSSQQNVSSREGLLGDLHQTLWLELHISLNRKLIDKVKIFKSVKDPACVVDIIEKLTPKIFIPGEYVFMEGELSSEMFIIVRGQVHVLVKANEGDEEDSLIHTLSEGKCTNNIEC